LLRKVVKWDEKVWAFKEEMAQTQETNRKQEAKLKEFYEEATRQQHQANQQEIHMEDFSSTLQQVLMRVSELEQSDKKKDRQILDLSQPTKLLENKDQLLQDELSSQGNRNVKLQDLAFSLSAADAEL
jgi:tRNA A58 N-methylase Trm61